MQKQFLFLGAILGAVAVILGAFGAHGLKAKITPDQLQVFETGVRYLFYHAFALLLCGVLYKEMPQSTVLYAGYAFIGGIVFFSGSLFLLSNKSWLGIDSWRWLGPITPVGGLMFIVGWLLLAYTIWKNG